MPRRIGERGKKKAQENEFLRRGKWVNFSGCDSRNRYRKNLR